MSKTTRFSIDSRIKSTERAKLRVLREDFRRMAEDKAYKARVIEQARARDAAWDYLKAECRPLRQGRLF